MPFRRLCVEFGAEITTSEMAYARQINRRSRAELALLRKHPSELCFGVQLAAGKATDAISAGRRAIDQGALFVDLNCGCPIHDVVKRGMGATLLQRPAALGRIVEAMVEGLSVPVTVKIRSGWKQDKNNASEVARIIEEAGAAGGCAGLLQREPHAPWWRPPGRPRSRRRSPARPGRRSAGPGSWRVEGARLRISAGNSTWRLFLLTFC